MAESTNSKDRWYVNKHTLPLRSRSRCTTRRKMKDGRANVCHQIHIKLITIIKYGVEEGKTVLTGGFLSQLQSNFICAGEKKINFSPEVIKLSYRLLRNESHARE